MHRQRAAACTFLTIYSRVHGSLKGMVMWWVARCANRGTHNRLRSSALMMILCRWLLHQFMEATTSVSVGLVCVRCMKGWRLQRFASMWSPGGPISGGGSMMSAAAVGSAVGWFTSSKDSRGRKNLLFLPVQFKTERQISILVKTNE